MIERGIFLVKLAISVGLIAYLVGRIENPRHLLDLWRGAHQGRLALALVLYVSAVVLGNWKWATLLGAQGIRVPFRALLAYTFVGTFFSNFLPANVGGDVMRGYGLAQYTQRTADAAVSVVMDRLVGLLAFLTAAVLVGTGLLVYKTAWPDPRFTPTAMANIRTLTTVAWVGEFGLMAAAGLLISRRSKRAVERFLHQVSPLRPLLPPYQRVATAVNAYRHAYGAILRGVLISWSVLVLTSVENWLLAQALMPGAVPFLYVLVLNPLIAFALLIPLSVGGLGISQSAYVFFFSLAGVSSTLSLAMSLLHQAIVYAGSLPGAVLWLRRRQVSTLPATSSHPL